LRPRLTTGLPFSPAHRRCACRPTSLPIGDRFATLFEVVGVFFDIFLVLRTWKVHRRFIVARYGIDGVGLCSEQLLLLSRPSCSLVSPGPTLCSYPYSPECVEEEFCELRRDGVLRSSCFWTAALPPGMLCTTYQRTLECAREPRPLRPDLHRRPARRGHT
jgi:hypothetical protein